MSSLIGKVTRMALVGLLVLGAAASMLPAPAAAQIQILTGVFSPGGGPPDAFFQVALGPVPPGTPVTLDFSGCQKLWLSAVQPMPPGFPPQVVGCLGHTVTTAAGPGGFALFRIVASSFNANGCAVPASANACATEFVGGLPVTSFFVATMDNDNTLGVSAADLASEISDVLCNLTGPPGTYYARSDIDGDRDVDAADIGAWLNVYLFTLIANGTNGGSCGDGGVCCALLP